MKVAVLKSILHSSSGKTKQINMTNTLKVTEFSAAVRGHHYYGSIWFREKEEQLGFFSQFWQRFWCFCNQDLQTRWYSEAGTPKHEVILGSFLKKSSTAAQPTNKKRNTSNTNNPKKKQKPNHDIRSLFRRAEERRNEEQTAGVNNKSDKQYYEVINIE